MAGRYAMTRDEKPAMPRDGEASMQTGAAPTPMVIRPDANVLDAYEQTDATARHTDPTSQER